MRRNLLLFGFLLLSCLSYGQDWEFFPDIKYEDRTRSARDFYSVYLNTGPSTYHGEMADISTLFPRGQFGYNFKEVDFLRFSAGFNYRLRAFHPLSIRTELSFYTIEGTDSLTGDTWKVNKRDLSFRARNFELWAGPQIDIFRYGGRAGIYNMPYRVVGYVYGGVGATTNFPTRIVDGVKYNLWEYETEGEDYDNVVMIFPMGIGTKVRIQQGLTVGVDVGYRLALSDYLDDVSGFYRDSASFESPIAQQLADPTGQFAGGEGRGNPDFNDGYMFTSLSIEYNFRNGVLSPRPNGQNGFGSRNPRRRSEYFSRAGNRSNSSFADWFRRVFNRN